MVHLVTPRYIATAKDRVENADNRKYSKFCMTLKSVISFMLGPIYPSGDKESLFSFYVTQREQVMNIQT
jgi:hypothetical protein